MRISTSNGKSYLARALGHQACMMEYSTIYANTGRLLKKLKLSKADGDKTDLPPSSYPKSQSPPGMISLEKETLLMLSWIGS